MEYPEISKISKSIKEREVAVFCGAGISWNSGLPLANELKQYILEKLPIDKKNIKKVMSSNFPFEAFIEHISGEDIVSSLMPIDISNLLNIYKDGNPNTNHILIARLAKSGYCKAIFTTNFDLLIEKALEKEKLKRHTDFEVYYDEKQISDFKKIGDEIIRIFKIHGSVDNINSIRTTMKDVASKTLSDKRREVIRYLFSTGKHRKVLILGYSCSDVFDITPQIQSIEKNRKEIIYLQHSDEGYIEEDIKIKNYKNPFKKFPGKRIKCNTDEFVKHLWNSLKDKENIDIGEYISPTKPTLEWKKYVDDWDRVLEENKSIKYYITASVFHGISSFNESIKYYNKTLEIIKDRKDKLEARCWGGLGYCHYMLGYPKKAIDEYKYTLKIARDIRDKEGEARVYLGLGYAYYDLGDYNNAIKYYNMALEAVRDRNDYVTIARCYAGLGYTYYRLGHQDQDKATQYFDKGLKISRDIGEKDTEAVCYAGLCQARYYSAGDYNKAIKAIKYCKKALKIAKIIKDEVVVSRRYGDLGRDYYRLGNFPKAIEWYKKSLKVAIRMEDKGSELRCYYNLGEVYYGSGEIKKAIEYYLKAEKIAKETETTWRLRGIYENLSHAYKEIGDYEHAEKYNKKLANFR